MFKSADEQQLPTLIQVSMGYENGIPSNKNSNLPPYPGEYGVKAEHDVPAATKMGASFTHVVARACLGSR